MSGSWDLRVISNVWTAWVVRDVEVVNVLKCVDLVRLLCVA